MHCETSQRFVDSSTPYLTNVAAGTEAVWILGLGVAVAALGQTLALHAAAARRARGVSLRSLGVACQYFIRHDKYFCCNDVGLTVAAGREDGSTAGGGEGGGRVCHADLRQHNMLISRREILYKFSNS